MSSERFMLDDAREALRLACRFLGGEALEGIATPARTNLAQSVMVRGRRYFIRAERLLGAEAARERLAAVEQLREQGVPWARPVDLLEIALEDAGADRGRRRVLPVSVWEWVEQVPGTPHPEDVAVAFRALHAATPPSGLRPRFGDVSTRLALHPALAPWMDRFRAVEEYALRWSQTSVVHGDPLSVNVLRTHAGVCFVDVDALAIGHPLVDWQYLARDARVDRTRTRVEWALRTEELEEIVECRESGWQNPDHPLWNAQRLVHLRRRLDLWEHDGHVEEDLAGCLGVAETVEEPPPGV